MKLYIGEYWVPFPSSEYGGTWALIAYNDEQAVELLVDNSGNWEEEYQHLIPDTVKNAQVFYLDSVHDHQVGIVNTFFT